MTYTARVFDKSKPLPVWIANSVSRRRDYWLRLWQAQPPWADTNAIRAVYKEAARLRGLGYDAEVHHIVPLNGEYVCGLHIAENLQIIDRQLNAQLSNQIYPGQPYKQSDFFGLPAFCRPLPKQYNLELTQHEND